MSRELFNFAKERLEKSGASYINIMVDKKMYSVDEMKMAPGKLNIARCKWHFLTPGTAIYVYFDISSLLSFWLEEEESYGAKEVEPEVY